MQFFLEQIAICPPDPAKAKRLLWSMTAYKDKWVEDHVVASGTVFGVKDCRNEANLSFNYGFQPRLNDPLELEILEYTEGPNWMDARPNTTPHRVSHLGMHCSEDELALWKTFFKNRRIKIAQEVRTLSHTNKAIKDKRNYHYCIFDTFEILGVDLKFIVRKDLKR